MKKNIFYSMLLLLVAFVSGCSDRLDIPKNGNMGGMDDFYQNDQEVDEATMCNEIDCLLLQNHRSGRFFVFRTSSAFCSTDVY